MLGKIQKITLFFLGLIICSSLFIGMNSSGNKHTEIHAAETEEPSAIPGDVYVPPYVELTEEQLAEIPLIDAKPYNPRLRSYTASSIIGGSTYHYNWIRDNISDSTKRGKILGVYEALMSIAENAFNSSSNFGITTVDGVDYYSAGGINASSIFSTSEIASALTSYILTGSLPNSVWEIIWMAGNACENDNPQYLSGIRAFNYSIGSSINFIPLYPAEYRTKAARDTAYSTINTKYAEYAALAGTATQQVDIVRLVHDKILAERDYAYEYSSSAGGYVASTTPWAHSLLGVMDTSNSGPVCEAYAEATQYILTRLNFNVVTAFGDTVAPSSGGGGYHAWNAVKIGEYYYWLDVTWDDMESTNPNSSYYDAGNTKNLLRYNYFLKGANNFASHYPNDYTGTNNVGSVFYKYGANMPGITTADINITTATNYEWVTGSAYNFYAGDANCTNYMISFFTQNSGSDEFSFWKSGSPHPAYHNLGTGLVNVNGIAIANAALYRWTYNKSTRNLETPRTALVQNTDYEVVVEKPYKVGLNRAYIYGKGAYRGVSLAVVTLNSTTYVKTDPPLPSGLSAPYGNLLSAVSLPSGWTWSSPNNNVGNAGTRQHSAVYAGSAEYKSGTYSLSVTVSKINPTYNAPTNLTATYGDLLSSVGLPSRWTWDFPNTTVGNVGTRTHSATYTPADTANYNNMSVPLDITVVKAAPPYTAPTNLTATYGDLLSSVNLPAGWIWDSPTDKVGTAGTRSHSATYTPTDTANYNTATISLNITVNKATPQYTVPKNLTAVYDNLLSSINLTAGWAWNTPTDKVGTVGIRTHGATYTPTDTANYNTVTISLDITVGKANPSYTAPTNLIAAYGDLLSSVNLPTGWKWNTPTDTVGTVGTRTHGATYTPADTVNYNTAAVSLNITVNKAEPSYTAPTNLIATYGDLLSSVTLPDDWAWVTPTDAVGDAGTQAHSATYTPTDTANFNTVTISLDIAVGKANPSYTVPENLTAVYGDLLSAVILPDGWAWQSPNTALVTVWVQTHSATYTPDDTDNYYSVTIELTVTVGKADPAVPTGFTAVYGDLLSDIELPAGWTWDSSGDPVGDAGTRQHNAYYTGSDEYKSGTYSLSVTVGKATPQYTAPANLTATYGDLLSTVPLSAGWKWNTSTNAVGDAGTRTHSATYTPADTANFNKVTESLNITVNKANPKYTAPTNLTAIYGDLLSAVPLPAGWNWDTPTDTVGGVGTRTHDATYTPADTANFNTVTMPLNIAVGKATPSYTAPGNLTATYGDLLSGVTLPAGFVWAAAGGTVGNAGIRTHNAIFTPDDTANYNSVTVGISVTVGKATPAYTAPANLTATYGDTLSAVILSYGWGWVTPDDTVGTVGIQIHDAIYTPTDTWNYNLVTVGLPITVEKMNPVIPTGLTATYGDVLSGIGLPDGWTWDALNDPVGDAGVREHTAHYAGTDIYEGGTYSLNITVAKADYSAYEPPAALTALAGTLLGNIELPAGWEWVTPTADIGTPGTRTYSARYTPPDTTNYNHVTISVTIIIEPTNSPTPPPPPNDPQPNNANHIMPIIYTMTAITAATFVTIALSRRRKK